MIITLFYLKRKNMIASNKENSEKFANEIVDFCRRNTSEPEKSLFKIFELLPDTKGNFKSQVIYYSLLKYNECMR